MSPQARYSFVAFTVVLIFALLACGVPAASSPPPGSDATTVAMQVQLTMQAAQNATLAAQLAQGGQQQQPPQGVQALPTYTPLPTYTLPAPVLVQPTPTNTPTQDLAAKIKSAHILVYEDVYLTSLSPWVKDALDAMGLDYKYDADASGYFMGDLNSSTDWDLIIVAAEMRGIIQGEFWDVITPKVIQDKTALVAEVWNWSNIANGRIKTLTAPCGVEFQSTRRDVDSIYTLAPDSPFFSTPNSGFSLVHYSAYWFDKGGDYMRLSSGSKATLLGGGLPKEKSSYGLIATCFDGRVIFQTFSNHDYNRSDIMNLWQNYITNTLEAHFAVVP